MSPFTPTTHAIPSSSAEPAASKPTLKTPVQDLPVHKQTRLVATARAARANAYAPYSQYAVGAAVLAADGRIYEGCNVENAMYGATICAERVATFSAVAAGTRRLVAAAVVTENGGSPCGACRQVLLEFGGPELLVLVAAADPAAPIRRFALGELLPHAWGPADLVEGATGGAGSANS